MKKILILFLLTASIIAFSSFRANSQISFTFGYNSCNYDNAYLCDPGWYFDSYLYPYYRPYGYHYFKNERDFYRYFNLNRSQYNQAIRYRQDARNKIRPLYNEFFRYNRELDKLRRSHGSRDQIDRHQREINEINRQMSEIRMRYQNNFNSMLNDRQRDRMRDFQPHWSEGRGQGGHQEGH